MIQTAITWRLYTVQNRTTGCSRSRAPLADPDHVLAALERPPVEPAVERGDVEARLVDQAPPLDRREPVQLHRGGGVARPHRQPQRPRRLVPVGALEDALLPLEPEAVGLGDVLGARCEHVEHEPAARLRAASCAARRARSFSASSGMCSSERKGQMTSCTRSSTGGSRRSPTRRSTREPTPCSSASARATASIPGERSTPITVRPGRAIGTAIRPDPTASSTTGPSHCFASST